MSTTVVDVNSARGVCRYSYHVPLCIRGVVCYSVSSERNHKLILIFSEVSNTGIC